MIKDTLQFSIELIEASLKLHHFKLRHKWRLGDQFCVTEDCELFWQVLFPDCIYLIDNEINGLIEELSKKGLFTKEESEKMVFIPRLEDIVSFCTMNIFCLDLSVEPYSDQTIYRARLSISSEDRIICEETTCGLRVAALRALATALQNYLPGTLPSSTSPLPSYL